MADKPDDQPQDAHERLLNRLAELLRASIKSPNEADIFGSRMLTGLETGGASTRLKRLQVEDPPITLSSDPHPTAAAAADAEKFAGVVDKLGAAKGSVLAMWTISELHWIPVFAERMANGGVRWHMFNEAAYEKPLTHPMEVKLKEALCQVPGAVEVCPYQLTDKETKAKYACGVLGYRAFQAVNAVLSYDGKIKDKPIGQVFREFTDDWKAKDQPAKQAAIAGTRALMFQVPQGYLEPVPQDAVLDPRQDDRRRFPESVSELRDSKDQRISSIVKGFGAAAAVFARAVVGMEVDRIPRDLTEAREDLDEVVYGQLLARRSEMSPDELFAVLESLGNLRHPKADQLARAFEDEVKRRFPQEQPLPAPLSPAASASPSLVRFSPDREPVGRVLHFSPTPTHTSMSTPSPLRSRSSSILPPPEEPHPDDVAADPHASPFQQSTVFADSGDDLVPPPPKEPHPDDVADLHASPFQQSTVFADSEDDPVPPPPDEPHPDDPPIRPQASPLQQAIVVAGSKAGKPVKSLLNQLLTKPESNADSLKRITDELRGILLPVLSLANRAQNADEARRQFSELYIEVLSPQIVQAVAALPKEQQLALQPTLRAKLGSRDFDPVRQYLVLTHDALSEALYGDSSFKQRREAASTHAGELLDALMKPVGRAGSGDIGARKALTALKAAIKPIYELVVAPTEQERADARELVYRREAAAALRENLAVMHEQRPDLLARLRQNLDSKLKLSEFKQMRDQLVFIRDQLPPTGAQSGPLYAQLHAPVKSSEAQAHQKMHKAVGELLDRLAYSSKGKRREPSIADLKNLMARVESASAPLLKANPAQTFDQLLQLHVEQHMVQIEQPERLLLLQTRLSSMGRSASLARQADFSRAVHLQVLQAALSRRMAPLLRLPDAVLGSLGNLVRDETLHAFEVDGFMAEAPAELVWQLNSKITEDPQELSIVGAARGSWPERLGLFEQRFVQKAETFTTAYYDEKLTPEAVVKLLSGAADAWTQYTSTVQAMQELGRQAEVNASATIVQSARMGLDEVLQNLATGEERRNWENLEGPQLSSVASALARLSGGAENALAVVNQHLSARPFASAATLVRQAIASFVGDDSDVQALTAGMQALKALRSEVGKVAIRGQVNQQDRAALIKGAIADLQEEELETLATFMNGPHARRLVEELAAAYQGNQSRPDADLYSVVSDLILMRGESIRLLEQKTGNQLAAPPASFANLVRIRSAIAQVYPVARPPASSQADPLRASIDWLSSTPTPDDLSSDRAAHNGMQALIAAGRHIDPQQMKDFLGGYYLTALLGLSKPQLSTMRRNLELVHSLAQRPGLLGGYVGLQTKGWLERGAPLLAGLREVISHALEMKVLLDAATDGGSGESGSTLTAKQEKRIRSLVAELVEVNGSALAGSRHLHIDTLTAGLGASERSQLVNNIDKFIARHGKKAGARDKVVLDALRASAIRAGLADPARSQVAAGMDERMRRQDAFIFATARLLPTARDARLRAEHAERARWKKQSAAQQGWQVFKTRVLGRPASPGGDANAGQPRRITPERIAKKLMASASLDLQMVAERRETLIASAGELKHNVTTVLDLVDAELLRRNGSAGVAAPLPSAGLPVPDAARAVSHSAVSAQILPAANLATPRTDKAEGAARLPAAPIAVTPVRKNLAQRIFGGLTAKPSVMDAGSDFVASVEALAKPAMRPDGTLKAPDAFVKKLDVAVEAWRLYQTELGNDERQRNLEADRAFDVLRMQVTGLIESQALSGIRDEKTYRAAIRGLGLFNAAGDIQRGMSFADQSPMLQTPVRPNANRVATPSPWRGTGELWRDANLQNQLKAMLGTLSVFNDDDEGHALRKHYAVFKALVLQTDPKASAEGVLLSLMTHAVAGDIKDARLDTDDVAALMMRLDLGDVSAIAAADPKDVDEQRIAHIAELARSPRRILKAVATPQEVRATPATLIPELLRAAIDARNYERSAREYKVGPGGNPLEVPGVLSSNARLAQENLARKAGRALPVAQAHAAAFHIEDRKAGRLQAPRRPDVEPAYEVLDPQFLQVAGLMSASDTIGRILAEPAAHVEGEPLSENAVKDLTKLIALFDSYRGMETMDTGVVPEHLKFTNSILGIDGLREQFNERLQKMVPDATQAQRNEIARALGPAGLDDETVNRAVEARIDKLRGEYAVSVKDFLRSVGRQAWSNVLADMRVLKGKGAEIRRLQPDFTEDGQIEAALTTLSDSDREEVERAVDETGAALAIAVTAFAEPLKRWPEVINEMTMLGGLLVGMRGRQAPGWTDDALPARQAAALKDPKVLVVLRDLWCIEAGDKDTWLVTSGVATGAVARRAGDRVAMMNRKGLPLAHVYKDGSESYTSLVVKPM